MVSHLTSTDIFNSPTLALALSLVLLASLASTIGILHIIKDRLVVKACAANESLAVSVVADSPTDHAALSGSLSLLILLGILPLLLLVVSALSLLLLLLLATLVSTKASLLVALVSGGTGAVDLLKALLSKLLLDAATLTPLLVVSTLRGVVAALATTIISPLSSIVIIGLIPVSAYKYTVNTCFH